MADTIYSKSSNLSTSVQKRRTLYLAESDPRANKDFISKYMNDYYAEVVIMSDAKYMAMMANELGMSNGVAEAKYAEVAPSTVLHAPTGLYWDINDSSATKFVTVNGSNYVNIRVSFDPGDNLSDSLQYEYYVDTTGTGANPGSTSSNSNAPISRTSISFSPPTTSLIEAEWDGISDALGYTVTVTGANLPPREYYMKTLVGPYAQTLQKSYYLNYDPKTSSANYNSPGYVSLNSIGKARFKLVPVSGSFSGSYVVTFVAHYTGGTSTERTARFNIGGGVTIDA